MKYAMWTVGLYCTVLPPLTCAQEAPLPEERAEAQRARRVAPERSGQRPADWKQMSEKDRKALVQFTRENFPRMALELDTLRENSPQKFERRMSRVAGEMRRLMDLKEKDPAKAVVLIRERQVALELQELARQYRAAGDDDGERARLRKTMREFAEKEFDGRMERRNAELRQLETRLAQLKTSLSEMESLREQMVERRMRELLDRKGRAAPEESEDASRGPSPRPKDAKKPE